MSTDPDAARLLADELVHATGGLRRAARRGVGSAWPGGQLTNAQVELVRVVRRAPGISVAQAAERLGLAANTVSTLVRGLVDAGVVARRPDPDDRRVARLSLTPSARRRVESWLDRRGDLVAGVVAGLSAADRAALAAAVPVIATLADQLRAAAESEDVA